MVKGEICLQKKTQRIFAGVLAVLISIAMVGSGLLVFFFQGDEQPPGSSAAAQTANIEAEYQAQKLRIDAMVEQAKIDPENMPLQNALGDEYYDAGMTAQMVAPTEMQENFSKAVQAYQKVVETNKDANIMVNLATSAFYSEDNELAEKSYQEALEINPEFLNGLINYGLFRAYAKQDWAGAIKQWQKALPLAQSSEKEQIQAMIDQAQTQLEASKNEELSNPSIKE